MAAGKWGLWHDEIGVQDILSMPIRLPKQEVESVEASKKQKRKTVPQEVFQIELPIDQSL